MSAFDPGVAVAFASWPEVRFSPVLLVVLLLAGVGTTALFLIGLAAYRRRRSRTYLLITLALGTLVVRTVVGLGTVFGVVPMGVHHLVEHTFDFLIAAVLLAAIYYQRRGPSPAPADGYGD